MIFENGEDINKQIMIGDSIGRKILDAAIDIINHEGYENLTIRKVAKQSGCSNSAIYMRFEDKDALARAIAELHAKPFLLIMDENYSKNADFYTNYSRITRLELDHLLTFDKEAIHMQVLYRGGLEITDNPFVLRLEDYMKNAAAKGEIKVSNIREAAYVFSSSFWGLALMLSAKENVDKEDAKKILDVQNKILCDGIKFVKDEDSIWDGLKANGVDVDKALERMNGNKDAYKSFLVEFFEDMDFENLKEAIDAQNSRTAFEYAHGLKGMAANLGLDKVHSELSVLVEILRQGGLEGAKEAYDAVIEASNMVTVLL